MASLSFIFSFIGPYLYYIRFRIKAFRTLYCPQSQLTLQLTADSYVTDLFFLSFSFPDINQAFTEKKWKNLRWHTKNKLAKGIHNSQQKHTPVQKNYTKLTITKSTYAHKDAFNLSISHTSSKDLSKPLIIILSLKPHSPKKEREKAYHKTLPLAQKGESIKISPYYAQPTQTLWQIS